MGLRVRKSFTICKGARVNMGKSGASLSFGTKGLRKTIHSSGRVTSSVGIPETGVYYTTSSGGKRNSGGSGNRRGSTSNASAIRAQQQAQLQQQKAAELENNQQQVQNYNDLLEEIRSIHKYCSDAVDWKYIYQTQAPYNPIETGPLEVQALKNIENAKPSFFGKLIPSIDKNRMQKMEQKVVESRQQDAENYRNWENMQKLSDKVLSGDIDSYFYIITEMHPFDDILDFGSDFDAGTDTPEMVEVEFHVKSDKVIPDHVLSLTQTGKLSSKEMTKTMKYDIVQDYVCSCIIRIAREMFALLPIDRILIHAVDSAFNTAIGYVEDITILSSLIERERFQKTNFDMIDPSDLIETFECHMDFKKTQGLNAVKRIEV